MASGAGAIKAGQAYVALFADDSLLIVGLKAAAAKLKAFGANIATIGLEVQGLGTAIVSPFLYAAKVFADAGSELNDMSARTGVSVEALSALGFAAQQTGTDMATVEGGIRKMQKSLEAGSEESLQAESAFLALGLSVGSLMKMSPEDQFQTIGKALSQIQNPTAKAAMAMQIFGKSGTALIPMIDDLDALTKQAKDLGLVWTGDEAKKADALGDSIDVLKASWSRFVAIIGSAVAPLLTSVAESLAVGAKYAIGWVKANGPLIVTAFEIGVAITALGGAIVGLGVAIYGMGAILGAMASGLLLVSSIFTFMISPLGLVVAGLAGLTTWFLRSTEAGQGALTMLGEGFASLKETAVSAFKGISDALGAGDIMLAGQILFAGLKVEFLKGLNYIQDLWSTWGVAVVEVVRGVQFKISSLMIDVWAGIQGAFVTGIASVTDIWTGFTSMLKSIWTTVSDVIIDLWNGVVKTIRLGIIESIRYTRIVAAAAGGPIGLGKKVEDINADAAKQKAAVEAEDKPLAEARAKRDAKAAMAGADAMVANREDEQNKLKAIEQGRVGAQAALTSSQGAEIDNRRAAAQADIEARAKKLEDAKGALEKLNAKALVAGAFEEEDPTLKKLAALGLEPTDKLPLTSGLTPEGLDQSIEQAKAKVDVAGTFSAAAASGLGVGQSVQDQQLNEQKKTNQNLEKLTKKVDKKQAVFT